jgi:hypothetical protein
MIAMHRGMLEIPCEYAPLSMFRRGGGKNRKTNPICKIPMGHIENVRNGNVCLSPSPGTGKKEPLKDALKETRPVGHGE